MNRKKLEKLWDELAKARGSLQDAGHLEDIASMAERTKYAGGNHVMWKSPFTTHRAFPISRHGKNQKVGHNAQKRILDQIEADAAAWEELLSAQEQKDRDEK